MKGWAWVAVIAGVSILASYPGSEDSPSEESVTPNTRTPSPPKVKSPVVEETLVEVAPSKTKEAVVKKVEGRPDRLFVRDVGGGNERPLVDLQHLELSGELEQDSKDYLEENLQSVLMPRFSPDEKTLYFISYYAMNSRGLYRVSLESREVRFMIDTVSLSVIHQCKDADYIGKIIVQPHFSELGEADHLIDWNYLVDEWGKKIATIGPGDAYVDSFMSKVCGVGTAKTPEAPEIPEALKKNTICGDTRLVWERQALADGSQISILMFRDRDHEDGDPDINPFFWKANVEEMLKTVCPSHFL